MHVVKQVMLLMRCVWVLTLYVVLAGNQVCVPLLCMRPQVKEEGYEVAHDGLLVTVFSAPNYCDQMGNKGAFVRFNGNDMVPHFTTFEVRRQSKRGCRRQASDASAFAQLCLFDCPQPF